MLADLSRLNPMLARTTIDGLFFPLVFVCFLTDPQRISRVSAGLPMAVSSDVVTAEVAGSRENTGGESGERPLNEGASSKIAT